MWGAGKLLGGVVPLLPRDAASRLQPKLDEALFETGRRMRRGMSRASVRCYWRRPLGHLWEMRERGGLDLAPLHVLWKGQAVPGFDGPI